RLLSVAPAGNSWTYRFSIPGGLSRYVSEKGSVSVDGVSLTVAGRGPREFRVAIIPQTRRATTLGRARVGGLFNFEADGFARYGPAGWRRRAGRPRRAR